MLVLYSPLSFDFNSFLCIALLIIGFTELQQNEVPAKLGGLLKAYQATSDTVVIISGDRNTRYKYISPVMNAAAQAGFSQVRINAEVSSEKKP